MILEKVEELKEQDSLANFLNFAVTENSIFFEKIEVLNKEERYLELIKLIENSMCGFYFIDNDEVTHECLSKYIYSRLDNKDDVYSLALVHSPCGSGNFNKDYTVEGNSYKELFDKLVNTIKEISQE